MELFSRMTVKNFKGLKDVEIELSKVNLFVGENGTGKSSVIQALGVLKRSSGTPGINTDLPYLNLGPISNVVTPGMTTEISLGGVSLIEPLPTQQTQVDFGCSVKFDVQGLSEYRTALKFRHRSLGTPEIENLWTRYGVSEIKPTKLMRPVSGGKASFSLGPTNVIGRAFNYTGRDIDGSVSKDEARLLDSETSFLDDLGWAIKMVLNKIVIVAMIRGLTEPRYELEPQPTDEFSPRAGIIQMGRSLAGNLVYYRMGEKISMWQKQILGIDVGYQLEPGPRIAIRNPLTGVDYVNEGFGSNQLLFVLERIADSSPGSLVAVEEPEIHMHPKAQFRFGKVSGEMVKSEDKQLLYTTHSEHIVNGVLNSVKQGVLKPQDVAIYYFEKKDRMITATRSSVDDEGRTTGGLKSFIEATMVEFEEYLGHPKL